MAEYVSYISDLRDWAIEKHESRCLSLSAVAGAVNNMSKVVIKVVV